MLLLFFACLKPINLKSEFDQKNCIHSLKDRLEAADCSRLSYMTIDGTDTIIRCHKQDRDRKSKWDTYAFRLVYSDVPVQPGYEKIAAAHKVCDDNEWRIEAYPPRLLK